jgi:hypothetical protein
MTYLDAHTGYLDDPLKMYAAEVRDGKIRVSLE